MLPKKHTEAVSNNISYYQNELNPSVVHLSDLGLDCTAYDFPPVTCGKHYGSEPHNSFLQYGNDV
jgi:hypothetical protein